MEALLLTDCAVAVRFAQLGDAFVLGDSGGCGRSVLYADTDAGRATAAFLQRYTALAGNTHTVHTALHSTAQHNTARHSSGSASADLRSHHPLPLLPSAVPQLSFASAARVLQRVFAFPCGHVVVVVGALSALAPVALALINGGASTDTIVPNEEIRAIFRQKHVVHLQAWDPNPLLEHTRLEREAGAEADTAQRSETGEGSRPLSTGGAAASGESTAERSPAPLAQPSLLSWSLGREDDEAPSEEQQQALRRLSRQRTHVHGPRTTVQRLTTARA